MSIYNYIYIFIYIYTHTLTAANGRWYHLSSKLAFLDGESSILKFHTPFKSFTSLLGESLGKRMPLEVVMTESTTNIQRLHMFQDAASCQQPPNKCIRSGMQEGHVIRQLRVTWVIKIRKLWFLVAGC